MRQVDTYDFIDGEDAAEYRQEAAKQTLEHASRYRETFATDSGKIVLEDLINSFIRQRIVQPGDDLQTMGIRQGGSDVVNRILQAIEYAETGGNPKI